jgi:hypothetical protein
MKSKDITKVSVQAVLTKGKSPSTPESSKGTIGKKAVGSHSPPLNKGMTNFQAVVLKPSTLLSPYPCLWVLEARKGAWWSCGATHCPGGLGYDALLPLESIPSTSSSYTLHIHTHKEELLVQDRHGLSTVPND